MRREDAENAGLRPCKRCKPNQASLVEHYTANVTKACRFIEESEKVPSLEELANHVGISMFHFHRITIRDIKEFHIHFQRKKVCKIYPYKKQKNYCNLLFTKKD